MLAPGWLRATRSKEVAMLQGLTFHLELQPNLGREEEEEKEKGRRGDLWRNEDERVTSHSQHGT